MIELERVEVRRNGRTILSGLDLGVREGEVRFLVGASGAGKTTALRLIAGLDVPDAGAVRINGQLASRPKGLVVPPHRRQLAMGFQDGALWEHLTIEQHLRFGLDARVPDPAERTRAVEDALELVGLAGRRGERPGPLSGGERQRLSLARALAQRPRLLLLDEPLAHVDLHAQRELATRLAAWIARHGATVIWVTHRPREVAFVGGSVSVLGGGRVAQHVEVAAVPSWLGTLDQ